MIRRTTALLVLVLGATWAAGAAAQDEEDRAAAREQFSTGVSRYEAGDYQGALEAFQEAYRLAPHPTVRVNMANCYEQLDRPLEALHHFERFLAEAESPSPQQRREVRSAIRRLEGRIGEVRLTVAPDGASVTIDNAETRRAPILEPVRLTAGTHHITVAMDGYETEHREVEVEGGAEQRLSIRLGRGEAEDAPAVAAADEGGLDEPAPAEEPASTDPAADEEDAAVAAADEASGQERPDPAVLPEEEGGGWALRITTPVIIGGAATAAFLATTVATGVAALVYDSDFEDAVARSNDNGLSAAQRNQARLDGQSAADTANALSIVSDVFLVGTIAGAGLTAFFVIVEGMDANRDTMARGEGLELRAAPSVGREGGGFVLRGRF